MKFERRVKAGRDEILNSLLQTRCRSMKYGRIPAMRDSETERKRRERDEREGVGGTSRWRWARGFVFLTLFFYSLFFPPIWTFINSGFYIFIFGFF